MSSKAGIYTDDLSRCLVESATSEDKITLVRWMFTSMALHPAIKDMANVNDSQRENANKEIAKLLVSLLTVKCLDVSKKAIKYDGTGAIQVSFSLLGQIAGKELFSNPDVAKALSALDEYIDKDILNKRLDIRK